MLFRREIEPACLYCGRGKRLNEREIYCAKRGAVPVGSSCPAFRYDPLKRVPPRPVSLPAPRFSLSDFSLSDDPRPDFPLAMEQYNPKDLQSTLLYTRREYGNYDD